MLSYMQQREQSGIEKGLAIGLEQGERQLLLKQLKSRFNPTFSQSHETKILQASNQEIDRWASNIFDAKTIDDVFL